MTGVLVRIGVVGVIVIGGLIFRDRLTGAATDLRVGDCFDVPTEYEVYEVQHRPCNEAHDAEIMWVGDYPAQDTYPGEEAFDLFTEANCLPTFQAYLGRAFPDPEFDLGVFYPLPDGWAADDHEITCYVYRLDEAKLMSSVKAG